MTRTVGEFDVDLRYDQIVFGKLGRSGADPAGDCAVTGARLAGSPEMRPTQRSVAAAMGTNEPAERLIF